MPADPVSDLAAALGADIALERPADPEHGDYATNAALRLAGVRRLAPRDLAAEIVAAAEAMPHESSFADGVLSAEKLARILAGEQP